MAFIPNRNRTGDTTSPFTSGASLRGFGSLKGFGTKPDLNSSEGLLRLAQLQGGALEQAANEIVNPTTGILSTIGSGLKNSFKGFIDVISVPNQIVAGLVSEKVTVGEAIKENISTSDVFFGPSDPDATTMQKVGGFITRLATDVLLDPLTYVTFGASAGLFGTRAVTKITARGAAAKALGVTDEAAVALSKPGTELFRFGKKIEMQALGSTKAIDIGKTITQFEGFDAVKAATGLTDESLEFFGKELDMVLKQTIDADLNPDFAKQAMSRLLQARPSLTEDLIDKGGIKFFNQAILSGQRIRSAMRMIPGMTMLDNVTAPTRTALTALFDPNLVKDGDRYVRIPEEFSQIIQKSKDLADSMKDARLGDISNIIRANKLTTTESKFLMASVEAGKLPADSRLANAYKQLLKFNDEELEMLQKSGVKISKLDNHAPHILNKQNTGKLMFRATPPRQTVNAARQRKLEGAIFSGNTDELTNVEKVLLKESQDKADKLLDDMINEGFEGFEKNLLVAHTARTIDNVSISVSKRMIKTVGDNFGIKSIDAPDGYVALKLKDLSNEEAVLAKLGLETEALRFHPAIAKSLAEFVGGAVNDPASAGFLKAYDKIQNLWKASVTSIFPAFHGRNAISNVFLNFNDIGLEALNPKRAFQSTQMLKWNFDANRLQKATFTAGKAGEDAKDELFDLMSKDIYTDAFGKKWSFGEMRQVMKNNNIAFNAGIVGPVDISRGTDEIIDALPFSKQLYPMSKRDAAQLAKKTLPIGQEFAPFKAGRLVGSAVEEQARIVNFMTNLQATGDVTLASQRTKQFLFDYNNLTNFERSFMRRMLPFYSFTRKNLEAQIKTLFTAPGRTSAQLTAVTSIGDAMSGQKLTPEEEAALPEWIRQGISILKTKRGPIAEIFGSLGTPIEAPFSALQPNQLLGSLSPLIRVPAEEAIGYNFFRGKPISEVTNATAFTKAPKFIKDAIGFTVITGKRSDGSTYNMNVALRPKMMHLFLNLPPTSRVLSSLKQMEAVDVSKQSKIAQFLIGVKPFSFDLEQEAQKREKELRTELEDLLTRAGVTFQFKRTFIPKSK